MTVEYIVGDVRKVIAGIPDGSVDFLTSSPPFLALRSYLPAGHDAKGDEIGSEANPAAFLDTLLGLTAEWGRVLAPHGSLAIELGDTYSGSSQGGGDLIPGSGIAQPKKLAMVDGLTNGTRRQGDYWPLAKSLALIPQLYAASLAYGRNILRSGLTARQLLAFMETVTENLPDLTTAELLTMVRQWIPQAESIQLAEFAPWRVRNVIVWHRPNPAVGALGDKVRPSTSYIVVATRSAKRWFDLTAVRTPVSAAEWRKAGQTSGESFGGTLNEHSRVRQPDPAGAPPLDAWFDEPDSELRPPRRVAMRDHRRLPDPKPEPAMLTSYIVVATRSAKRWFDLTAVRTAYSEATIRSDGGTRNTANFDARNDGIGYTPKANAMTHAGAPPLDAWFDEWDGDLEHDTWTLTTQPSSLAHYAMWPAKLAERLILMMCPREVCRVCGEPRRRVEGHGDLVATPSARIAQWDRGKSEGVASDRGGMAAALKDGGFIPNHVRPATTLGWTDCGCGDTFAPGIVLDPFAGTGTTLAVADLHGRDAIGIDIDERNRDIYPARYDEVKRALFGTPPPMPGQGDLFAEVAE